MSDPEKLNEKMKKMSWKSNLILTCPDTNDCPFSNEKKVHQHAFTAVQIVPPNNDSRSLLTVVKGVIFSNLKPMPFDSSLDAEPESCFNCRRKGHAYKKCWREKTLYCVNCGRREVQVDDCPRCARGYREFVKNGNSIREMRPMVTDVSSRGRARSVGRTMRDKSRGRARNSETFETRDARDKSRGRSKVRWLDLQDPRGDEPKNVDNKGRDGGNMCGNISDRAFGNRKVKDGSLATESNEAATREFLDVMAAVKHLPPETQNAVALHFLKQREGR